MTTLLRRSCGKINIGLAVTGKRTDGYHDIVSCLYPISWCDTLHFSTAPTFSFTCNKKEIEGDNLCLTAFRMLQRDFAMPNVHIHLEKRLPIGAGLGGGSSNAVHCLLGLEELFSLPLTHAMRTRYARALGSDCPFFLQEKTTLATQKGDVMEEITPPISGSHLLVVYPSLQLSTASVYAAFTKHPFSSRESVPHTLRNIPRAQWKEKLHNDLEKVVFARHPALRRLKEALYQAGAWYASLSGSGSAVYGLFHTPPPTQSFASYEVWEERLA